MTSCGSNPVDRKVKVLLDFNYKHLSDLLGGNLFGYIWHSGNKPTQYEIGIISVRGEWVVEFVSSDF